jgi:uncharacterized protein YdeI (YjbR/CyaY-like superfamily)
MSPIERPTRDHVRIFPAASDFRDWLAANHGSAPELFVGFYKKASGKSAMTYAQAVDEALCFGWIDGITFRIDDEVTATRFTPRRPTSNWSAVNIAKVAALRAAGRMTPAGDRAFDERDRRNDAVYSYEREAQELPPDWIDRFMSDADAWAHWTAETPSYRRTVTHWVLSAKRPETRERRFATLMTDSAAGRRVGPMLVSRADRRADGSGPET